MASPLGRYAGDAHDELVAVQLIDAPLRIWQRAAEHHDELMRETALIALTRANHDLPQRLQELIHVLGQKYGAARARPDDERDAAMAAGEDRIDLTYEVPRSTAEAAQRMRDLLDEAEEYCRTYLLTLEQPPEQAAFARWYIDQFVQQCAGKPATPWPGPWS